MATVVDLTPGPKERVCLVEHQRLSPFRGQKGGLEGRPSTGPGTKEAAGFPGEEGCGTLSSGPCSLQGPRPCRGQTNKRIAQRRIRLPFEVSLPLIDLPRSCPALASARRFLRSEERDTFCYWAGATKGSSRRRGLTAIPSGAIACAPALLADPRRMFASPLGTAHRWGEAARAKPRPARPPLYCRLERRALWTRRTRAGSPSKSSRPLTMLLFHAASSKKASGATVETTERLSPFADSAAAPLPKAPDSHGLVAGPLALSLCAPEVCAPPENVSRIRK